MELKLSSLTWCVRGGGRKIQNIYSFTSVKNEDSDSEGGMAKKGGRGSLRVVNLHGESVLQPRGVFPGVVSFTEKSRKDKNRLGDDS